MTAIERWDFYLYPAKNNDSSHGDRYDCKEHG
jgi:hypothetical protein